MDYAVNLAARLRRLHEALKTVVENNCLKKTTGLRWLLCGDAIGWQLQLLSSFLLFIEAFAFGNTVVVVDGAILLFSLGPMIILQHAVLETRAVELVSRAQEMLSQIESIAEECEQRDVVSTDAFTFAPNSRCISNVVLNSGSSVDVGIGSVIPAQLLLAGDEIRTLQDDWISKRYCEARIEDANKDKVHFVHNTPSAVQLEAVLRKDPHPESFYEYRHNSVVNILRKMLLGAMILSVLSSILHVLLASNGRYFENLLLRNVDVCLPILPLSFSLLSILLKVGCNAYVSALIELMQSSPAADGFLFASASAGATAKQHAVRRRASRRTWLQRLRSMAALSDGETDRISMLPAADTADAAGNPLASTAWTRSSGSGGGGGGGGGGKGGVTFGLWWAHVSERLRRLLSFSFGGAARDPTSPGGPGGGWRPGGDVVSGLGSATVLSFTDLHGVLADAVASPRHIYVLTPPPPSPPPGAEEARGAWAALELSGDGGGGGGVRFEDSDAAAGHLGQLKPLGLNCLVRGLLRRTAHAAPPVPPPPSPLGGPEQPA